MSYVYANEREEIFTDKGQREFLIVRDKAKKLLKLAGVFTLTNVTSELSGSSWTMMAYVDRLVELGEIREIIDTRGHERIFIGVA